MDETLFDTITGKDTVWVDKRLPRIRTIVWLGGDMTDWGLTYTRIYGLDGFSHYNANV